MYYATQIKHVFGNCHWYSYTLSNIKWTRDSSVFCSLPASIEQQRMSISDISRLDWKRHIQMNNSLDLIQFLQHANWTISRYLKIHESLQIQRNWFITKYFGFHFHPIKYGNFKCVFCNTCPTFLYQGRCFTVFMFLWASHTCLMFMGFILHQKESTTHFPI